MPTTQTPPESGNTPKRTVPQTMPGPFGDVPLQQYQEVTDVAYGEDAATTFEVEEPDRHTIVLRGPCPRCQHMMDFIISDEVVRRHGWFL